MTELWQRKAAYALVVPGVVVGLALAGCAKSSTTAVGSGTQKTPSKDITIALSNSFLGNTWRQTMVKIFQDTAQKAKAEGLIKGYMVSNTSENTATEQIAAMKSLILKRPSAILIDSASPTAMDPVIEQACSAGIVVITFDSVGSAPCEYNEQADLTQYGALGAEGVLNAIHGKGNVIVVRGVVGSAPEKTIFNAQMAQIKKHPGVKVIAQVQGEASNSVTQQAVQAALPSWPTIQGVITGGSTFGALEAFKSAGRPVPFGNFANDGTDLALWEKLVSKNPKFRATSVRPDPGQSAFALWQALDILHGAKVPKNLTSPNVVITDTTLNKWIAVTPVSDTAAWQWTQQQALAGIAAQQAGRQMPEPPIPTKTP
ncbi:MAG: substrate-binding domain-containing protein [Streptosporangiaceae bacterium]